MSKDPKKEGHGYPPYDDDRFYDTTHIVSQNDCTGLEPHPPINEAEAEAYGELYNIPQSTEEVNNGLQDIKKTQNNEDITQKDVDNPPYL